MDDCSDFFRGNVSRTGDRICRDERGGCHQSHADHVPAHGRLYGGGQLCGVVWGYAVFFIHYLLCFIKLTKRKFRFNILNINCGACSENFIFK